MSDNYQYLFEGGSFDLQCRSGDQVAVNEQTLHFARTMCEGLFMTAPECYKKEDATTRFEQSGRISAGETKLGYDFKVRFNGLDAPADVLLHAFASLDDDLRAQVLLQEAKEALHRDRRAGRSG